MAASVSYKINGKYDGKAVTQAQKSFQGLANAAKKISGAFLAVASVSKVTQELTKSAQSFKANNTAQTAFFKSLQNNSKVAASSVRGLVKEFDSMSGYFTGEELVKAGSTLSNLGLNEDQMKKVMQTAKDMAASGVMPLDQAVKSLGQSYGGNISALKKLYPELKQLTDKEIKNGEAVDFLAGKYAGFEDSMSKTFDGMDRKYANKLDGVRDAVGSIVTALKFEGQAKMLEPLQNIANWFNTNRNQVINFFLHFPDVVKASMSLAWKNIKTYFSLDGIKSYGEMFLSYLKLLFQAWWDLFVAFAQTLVTPIVAAFQLIKDKITTIWESIIQSIKNMFFEGINALYDKLPSFIRNWLDGKGFAKIKIETKDIQGSGKTYKDYLDENWDKAQASWQKVADNFGTNVDNLKSNMMNFASKFEGNNQEFISELEKILGQDLPEDLKAAFNELPSATGNGTSNSTEINKNEVDGTMKSIMSSFGQLGSLMESLLSSNWIGMLIQLISAGVEDLKEKSPVFKEFLNVFSMIAKELNDSSLVDFFNSVLPPIMNALKAFSKAISSSVAVIFDLLQPVLTVFATVIEYVAKVIATVGVIIYNMIITVYNLLAWIWGGTKAYKSVDEIWNGSGGSTYNDSSSGSDTARGSAASYNAARDVYVTINYNNSYVNGDAREIALSIYREIQSAERLGYA